MGSLTSRPSVPSQPQIVTVTQPAPAPAAAPAPEEPAKDSARDIRKKTLLDRERGRFGTIATGFRGLLGASQNTSARKTLLGE